jgi:hypothetical protein
LAGQKPIKSPRSQTKRAKGHTVDDMLSGYWEWFRKDGTRMRSGYFENGEQAGEWTDL